VANFNPDKDLDMDKNEDDRESRIMISNNKKMPSSSRSNLTGGNLNANDRFYEEYEYERRLRKRRARLMTSTEEAFTHIKRMSSEMTMPNESTNTSTITDNTNNVKSAAATLMDPFEAAQAVFTSIARDLRRYLRVTRQQPFFTRDSILAHLANCLSYDMSPKSFLQRYLNSEPLIFNERALVSASALQQQKLSAVLSNGNGSNGVNYNLNLKTIDQSWILISDTALYQNIEDNLMLVLKQNEVSLMCTFKRLPRFNLIEDILDPKRNKFVLKLNSETTV
jgi:vang-like